MHVQKPVAGIMVVAGAEVEFNATNLNCVACIKRSATQRELKKAEAAPVGQGGQGGGGAAAAALLLLAGGAAAPGGGGAGLDGGGVGAGPAGGGLAALVQVAAPAAAAAEEDEAGRSWCDYSTRSQQFLIDSYMFFHRPAMNGSLLSEGDMLSICAQVPMSPQEHRAAWKHISRIEGIAAACAGILEEEELMEEQE